MHCHSREGDAFAGMAGANFTVPDKRSCRLLAGGQLVYPVPLFLQKAHNPGTADQVPGADDDKICVGRIEIHLDLLRHSEVSLFKDFIEIELGLRVSAVVGIECRHRCRIADPSRIMGHLEPIKMGHHLAMGADQLAAAPRAHAPPNLNVNRVLLYVVGDRRYSHDAFCER